MIPYQPTALEFFVEWLFPVPGKAKEVIDKAKAAGFKIDLNDGEDMQAVKLVDFFMSKFSRPVPYGLATKKLEACPTL